MGRRTLYVTIDVLTTTLDATKAKLFIMKVRGSGSILRSVKIKLRALTVVLTI